MLTRYYTVDVSSYLEIIIYIKSNNQKDNIENIMN